MTIAEFYVQKLIPSAEYDSPKATRKTELLYPPFHEKLQKSIEEFHVLYPDVEIVFVETYRSNTLQLKHFNSGASKIRKNGMHHYGIAVDIAFIIDGEFTYQGDYKHLRECHSMNGLHLLGAWDIGHVQFVPVSQQTSLRREVDKAVKAFQKSYGLVVDGIVGSKTRAKAIEVFGTV